MVVWDVPTEKVSLACLSSKTRQEVTVKGGAEQVAKLCTKEMSSSIGRVINK